MSDAAMKLEDAIFDLLVKAVEDGMLVEDALTAIECAQMRAADELGLGSAE